MRRGITISEAVVAALVVITAVTIGALLVGLPWMEHPAVLPMTIVTAAVLLAPLVGDRRDRTLDVSEPFTLVVWTMAFWHFVVGAAAYCLGRQDDIFYLTRLGGDGTIVVTQFVVLIGLVAFGVAARAVSAGTLARRVRPRLPLGPTVSHDLQVVTWTLLGVGVFAAVIGRATGDFGYSAIAGGGAGVATTFAAMMAAAAPITCVDAWRAGASRRATIAMASGIATSVVVQAAAAGNRGTVVTYAIVAVIALNRLDRRFDGRRVARVAVGGAAVLAVAVVYGSAYRSASTEVDGSVSDDFVENSREAVTDLWDRGPGVVGYGADRFVERLDSLLSASVVVEQYEALDDAEEAAGLDGDILRAAGASLVPRVVWPGKPSTDPQALAVLYFGFPNAYATTPMTTLLRNFGPSSVPLGMALVGFALGLAHRALVGRGSWTSLRGVVYVVVTTRAVNFEGSYASFLPDATRIVIVLAGTFGLAWLIARSTGGGSGWLRTAEGPPAEHWPDDPGLPGAGHVASDAAASDEPPTGARAFVARVVDACARPLSGRAVVVTLIVLTVACRAVTSFG